MQKKIALLLVIGLVAVMSTSAFGIGAAYSLPLGDGLPGSGVMLSGKFDGLPLIGLGFALGSDTFQLGVTADWWLIQGPVVSILSGHVGVGAFLGINDGVDIGVRVPAGLSIYPANWLEIFIELAPTLSIGFADPIRFPQFGAQAAAGLRFWFN